MRSQSGHVPSPQELSRRPQRGAVFENWVLTEILKDWHHRGEEPPVFFWRDMDGHEVDFVLQRAGRLHPVEVKAGRTVQPDFFQGIRYLGQQDESVTAGLVVYGGDSRQALGGTAAVPWRKLSAALDGIRSADS